MHVVYSARHALHAPVHDIEAGFAIQNVERPARAECIVQVLRKDARFRIDGVTQHGLGPIEAVHAPGLIRYLAEVSVAAEAELFPDTVLHPGVREGMDPAAPEPDDATGRNGYWCFDTGTPVLQGTYVAARDSVDGALTAADRVLSGESASYALCRPPGHHAARAVFGGFCYFNNAAIAAEYLAHKTGGRVAVLDIDYHHGNGTQQIFYGRADVLCVSLHADPKRAFPFFTGYADETGAGPGLGATRNFPLPPGVTDPEYLRVLEEAVETVSRFQAAVTLVSLGIDTYGRDPLGDFDLTTGVYAECGARIATLGPVVVLQEGGYYLADLGENVRQFLLGFERVH